MLANGAAAEPSAAEKAAGLDAGLTLVQIGKMWHWHDEDGRITPGPRWEAGHSSVNTSEKVTT